MNTTTSEITPVKRIVGFKGTQRKILLVDDNTDSRTLLKDILQPLGFDIAEARNGSEALTIAMKWHPDLIFMDIIMPELNGLEATHRLRQHLELHNTIIIIISASVFPSNRQQGVEAGGNDFMAKPLNTEELLQKIARHLSLTWRYEHEPEQILPETAPLIFPSHDQLRAIFEFARDGFFKDIILILDQLDLENQQYSTFTQKIRVWITQFESEAICEFLEQELGGSA